MNKEAWLPLYCFKLSKKPVQNCQRAHHHVWILHEIIWNDNEAVCYLWNCLIGRHGITIFIAMKKEILLEPKRTIFNTSIEVLKIVCSITVVHVRRVEFLWLSSPRLWYLTCVLIFSLHWKTKYFYEWQCMHTTIIVWKYITEINFQIVANM